MNKDSLTKSKKVLALPCAIGFSKSIQSLCSPIQSHSTTFTFVYATINWNVKHQEHRHVHCSSSFYKSNKKCVQLNLLSPIVSHPQLSDKGVPQGSVSGILQFTVYINNVYLPTKFSIVMLTTQAYMPYATNHTRHSPNNNVLLIKPAHLSVI